MRVSPGIVVTFFPMLAQDTAVEDGSQFVPTGYTAFLLQSKSQTNATATKSTHVYAGDASTI
jgi:hypothetical protein